MWPNRLFSHALVFVSLLVISSPGAAQENLFEAVDANSAQAANSDPNYRALRDGKLNESYAVSNLTLQRDVGKFTLKSGRITFLQPVLDRVVMGVFTGEGEFTLTPGNSLERGYLQLLTQKETVREAFDRMVICFTDETYQEIKQQGQSVATDQRAEKVLGDFRNRVRRSRDNPRSQLEGLLSHEDAENMEAELLAGIYNPAREGFFSAFLFGRQHSDLRFHLRPRGVLPQLPAPEEVALLNVDPQGKEEGIWYLSHLDSEIKSGRASSDENKWVVDVEHYRIETFLRGKKLEASAELTFRALTDGDRVLRFGLLPTLRVSRVALADGRGVSFIQEKEDADGSFYVVLPDPLVMEQQYKLTIEYAGDEVVEDAGGGNFAVGARTSWYPSVNTFSDRATFDLTFKVPKQYLLVSVGKPVKEWKEDDFAATQWVSEVPLAVAGFNYGRFKKKEVFDEATNYQIEGFAVSRLPDYLRAAPSLPTQFRPGLAGPTMAEASPTRLTENLMVEAQNSLRLFTNWFGELPYGRLAITQQPQFNFGQSWPTLIYLPIIAFFDSTQRHMMGFDSGFTDFVQEVTPHEVAHQWWGHVVGWSSFHDQWLSEGFADFSASIYLQIIERKNPGKYLQFWEQNRKAILEKNRFGIRPNDAGPIWMGLRLNTYKTPGAYSQLVYPKGSYILHMLRWIMFERQTGDQRFIAMMHDFVKTHFNQNASTESFKQIVEKHMQPAWDLDGNGRMDWFFNQWVYGTEVPSYRFDYSLTPQNDGKVLLTGSLTQSGVSDNFKMLVPIYLDFDGNLLRLGAANIMGSTTMPELKIVLPQKPKRVLINAHYDVLAFESISKEKK